MNFYKLHQELLKNVMVETQKCFPERIRIFQQHVGKFFKRSVLNAKDTQDAMKHIISVGRPGMSDLFFIFKTKSGVGRFGCIEIKTGNAKQTKEQKNYQKMIENLGGVYIVGRDTAQVIEEIKKHDN